MTVALVLAMQPVYKQRSALTCMPRSSESEAEQMGIYKRGGKYNKVISLTQFLPTSLQILTMSHSEALSFFLWLRVPRLL